MNNLIACERRTLWLVYERVPHPDAVSYPADEEDVRLALGLLGYPRVRRAQLADRLRKINSKIFQIPSFDRPNVPARTPSGLYRSISWRFAQWLACVLRSEGTVRERLVKTLETWLQHGAESVGSTDVLRNQSA